MRRAIVALYSSPDSVAEEAYLACGVFIAPGVVLTVKHVFEGRGRQGVFVRPFGAQAAYPIHADPTEHPNLDAAWFHLDQMPPDATVLSLDLSNPLPNDSSYVLNGYFEGQLSTNTPRTVVCFEPTLRRYLVEPSHGRGLSGGALCRGDRVCALATDRYTEVSANRGCFVAMHQLHHGFLDGVIATAASGKVASPGNAAPARAAVLVQASDGEGLTADGTTSAMRGYLDRTIQRAKAEFPEQLAALLQAFKQPLTGAADAHARLESKPDSAHGFLAELHGAIRSAFPVANAGRGSPGQRVVDVAWALCYLALERLVREKLGAAYRAPAGAIPLPADASDQSLHLLIGAMLSSAGVCVSYGANGAEAENVVTDSQASELGHLSQQQAMAAEAHAKAMLAVLDEPMASTRGSYRGRAPDRHEIAAALDMYAEARGGVRMVVAVDLARLAEGQGFEDYAAALQSFGLHAFATRSQPEASWQDVSDIAGQVTRALKSMAALLAQVIPSNAPAKPR